MNDHDFRQGVTLTRGRPERELASLGGSREKRKVRYGGQSHNFVS